MKTSYKERVIELMYSITNEMWDDYRFGQCIFNKVINYFFEVKNIENQDHMFQLCLLSDKFLFDALEHGHKYRNITSEDKPKTTKFLQRKTKCCRRRLRMITLLKKVTLGFVSKVPVMKIIMLACGIMESSKTPSSLYYIKDRDLIRGLEIINDMSRLHYFR